ncbi:deacetylase complex subunit [Ophiostoma piceae UAMH 11346]|uniref:Deacetylase complex subunit n=1 Tax=Ophiostoma piceae (strain UAMH 11346) TaxID=1262450 RepID=S3C3Q9_OPHP1|nr:deacetylase complex subunit [Ophiostoma piceae UAMH 11346]
MATTDLHSAGLGGASTSSDIAASERLQSLQHAVYTMSQAGNTAAAAAPGSTSQSQSKRDKKRQLLTDRLAALSEKFGRDRDMTYREQLQKIQIDTNLVMRLDPYTDRPLDFLGQDRASRERELNRDPDPEGRGGGRGVLEMAGPTFQQWIQEIEDLVEERDAELTKQKFEYEKKAQEHKNTHAFKTDTAVREHRHLSATLRERLTNAITAKKVRLTKEKEALEISDASALLLHPNQFSITNPASPGGGHSKRATRLRQTADDLAGIGGGADARKRKRNGDDDGSPAPQRRTDNNGTTPLWHGDRLGYRKVTGPVYSIDKLFTDKELAMTYNNAALASHKYLLSHRTKVNSNGELVSSNSDTESGDDDNHGMSSYRDATPLASVGMERVPSHATRSTRGGNNGTSNAAASSNFVDDRLVGLEALTNFEMPSNLEKLAVNEPKMPPMFMSNYAKPHSKMDANTPATLSGDDVSSDLSVIKTLRQYERAHGVGSNFDNSNGGRKVLEATAFAPHDSRYVAYLKHDRRDDPAEDLRKDLRLPALLSSNGNGHSSSNGPAAVTSSVRDEPMTPSHSASAAAAASALLNPLHATPMSRQSSQGGAAMSRQGSNTRAQRKRNI